jgi:hypothetical protein
MIPTLIGIGVLCYSALWLRRHYSGQVTIIPALILLRLLALAAVIWAACEIAIHHRELSGVSIP